MKRLIGDMHSHTIVSGHAYGTIREMAQAASDMNLKVLGITEHGPGIPGTVDPFYYNNFEVVPKTLYGVRVLFGCEINILNDGTLKLDQCYIDKLDYAIAGIHCLCYENVGREGNTDNIISVMKNEKVKIISHPDDDHTPLNYERLVEAAKQYDVALELNNSSFRKQDRRLNCVENYKVMLDLCKKFQVPIVIDSDAHDPSQVGDGTLALDFLKTLDFDETLILNNDYEKLMRFLGVE